MNNKNKIKKWKFKKPKQKKQLIKQIMWKMKNEKKTIVVETHMVH